MGCRGMRCEGGKPPLSPQRGPPWFEGLVRLSVKGEVVGVAEDVTLLNPTACITRRAEDMTIVNEIPALASWTDNSFVLDDVPCVPCRAKYVFALQKISRVIHGNPPRIAHHPNRNTTYSCLPQNILALATPRRLAGR